MERARQALSVFFYVEDDRQLLDENPPPKLMEVKGQPEILTLNEKGCCCFMA
jgi:hypothetical protein